MRRFELGMSLNYVEDWTVSKAVNEIFQNALDEEIQNPSNKLYFDYDSDGEVLRIGNKFSKLSTQSLLLGSSSKRDDENTIGTHGEGYKVAAIVLLRNGCGMRVYNYNEKEIWSAKIVQSRRYHDNIVVFDVEKIGVFKQVPEYSLVFEITNISKDIYEEVKSRNLLLQDDLGEFYHTKYGNVLLDERFAGKVFVKGLYVCDKEQLEYGYDLEPSLIKLDRDRGLIDSFNLQYSLGKLLICIEDIDFLSSVKDKWDGYYIRCFTSYCNNDIISNVYDNALSKFTEEYGKDAIPCVSTSDFNRLKRRGYNVAMVSENDYHFITRSSGYSGNFDENLERDLSEELDDWFDSISKYLPSDLLDKGKNLIEDIKEAL